MSVLLGLLGVVLGAIIGIAFAHYYHRRVVSAALEEGFRSFIEFYIDGIERDSEVADKMWEATVEKKQE